MPVGEQGIQVGNNPAISWDDFNKIRPEQQKALLVNAGVPTESIDTLLGALQKMEIGEGQAYEKQHQERKTRGNIFEQIGQTAEGMGLGLISGPLGAKKIWEDTQKGKGLFGGGRDYATPQELYQSSGLADIIKNVGLQSTVNTSLGLTPGGQQAQTGGAPVFSAQNLKDYEQSYIMPLLEAYYGKGGKGGMLSGEIDALQQSIGAIGKATGQSNSPLTTLMKGQLAGLLPLEQKLGKDQIIANQIKPFLDIINQQIGTQASLGAKYSATGAGIENFLQYAASDPTMSSYLSAIGLGSGVNAGGASSISNLLAGLGAPAAGTATTNPVAGVNALVPGYRPATTGG